MYPTANAPALFHHAARSALRGRGQTLRVPSLESSNRSRYLGGRGRGADACGPLMHARVALAAYSSKLSVLSAAALAIGSVRKIRII